MILRPGTEIRIIDGPDALSFFAAFAAMHPVTFPTRLEEPLLPGSRNRRVQVTCRMALDKIERTQGKGIGYGFEITGVFMPDSMIQGPDQYRGVEGSVPIYRPVVDYDFRSGVGSLILQATDLA